MSDGARYSNLLPGHYDALGYKAAAYARESGAKLERSETADFHMRYDRETVIDLARQMDRDVWLIEGLLNRSVDYILGPVGFTLQAKTADPSVNAKIEQEIWPPFADAPEVTGKFDWRAYQALTFRESLCPGDQLHLKVKSPDAGLDGRFQHVEAERLASSLIKDEAGNIVEQGVVLDPVGRTLGWRVCDVDRWGYIRLGPGVPVDAQNGIFFGQPFKRSSQSRCMPIFTSSLPIAHRLDDILTSEAVAWQLLSRLVVTLKREQQTTRSTFVDGVNAKTKSGPRDGSAVQLITDMDLAILFQCGPKDELDVVPQNRPNLNLAQNVETFVRLFCVPIGMPAEVLLLYWRQFNYSSARIVLLQAFLAFRRHQQHLATCFCSRAYRWQIGRAIARGTLPWRPDILQHEWQVPSWPWIDEDKEVSAWAKKLDRLIATQTECLGSLGKDPDEQREQRKKEVLNGWKTCLEIEEATKKRIKAETLFRHFIGLETGLTELGVRAGQDPTGSNPADGNAPPEGDTNAPNA